MSSWRKKLFGLIVLALAVLTIVFWGQLIGGICLFILIQSLLIFMFNSYASRDLAKTFDENGENVKGWRD